MSRSTRSTETTFVRMLLAGQARGKPRDGFHPGTDVLRAVCRRPHFLYDPLGIMSRARAHHTPETRVDKPSAEKRLGRGRFLLRGQWGKATGWSYSHELALVGIITLEHDQCLTNST